MNKSFLAGAICLCAQLFYSSIACAITTINFDSDADGNTINAPDLFADAVALTTLYSSLGVTFSGPATLDGGAILDQLGDFGIPARSGRNFLAFATNEDATGLLQDGGSPFDPESIIFDSLVKSVSIYASGGGEETDAIFLMEAFDASDALVDSDTVAANDTYGLLSVSSALGIKSVQLTQIGTDTGFVYDDLNFSYIPIPPAIYLYSSGLLGLIGICRHKKTT